MLISLGLDFGTDSVRALLVDVQTGQEVATGVAYYPRWRAGQYCAPVKNRFRQHPADYQSSMVQAVRSALQDAPGAKIIGIGVDTTGSTIVAVDENYQPLSLSADFAEDPDAMFVLWKDHTAVAEAEEINNLCRQWPVDYTKYSGGVYSSEWFWSKITHITRQRPDIAAAAHSWVEHCDWIPQLLSGSDSPLRSRCAAGHKALWHPEWGGLPSEDFLTTLEPGLTGLRARLYEDTHTNDQVAGKLTEHWAKQLGLPAGIPVMVGAFDAHCGAIGAGAKAYELCKIMGTSTCDVLSGAGPENMSVEGEGRERGCNEEVLIAGICGQVLGSVLPDRVAYEAGQSAFGDVFAWYARLLNWGRAEPDTDLIARLSAAASALPRDGTEVALDWFNGRRTPNADQTLKGAIANLSLGSDAPRVFRALVEATCFGSLAILDTFLAAGVPVKRVLATGGVAKKSPFVVQTLANVLNRPVAVVASEQTCALGAAIFAAVGAGQYPDTDSAMQQMASAEERLYLPQPEGVADLAALYQRYKKLGTATSSLPSPAPAAAPT